MTEITMEFARRDDCLEHMVPSDLRLLLGKIEQLQTKLAESEARVGKLHGDILHINEYWNGDFNEQAMLDALNHITNYTANIIDENIEQLRQQQTNGE